MSTFTVAIEIAGLPRQTWRRLTARVDTGATLTTIPASLLAELGIEAEGERRFEIADGSYMDRPIGYAWIRIDDRETTTPVVFGNPGDAVLLGAITLEALFLGVDPVRRQLVPVTGWL